MERKEYFIGVDIGQIRDHTAIAVVEVLPATEKTITPTGKLTLGGATLGTVVGQPIKVAEREPLPRLQCHYLQTLRLGIKFQDIAQRLSEIEAKLMAKGEAEVKILVDATGPGQPIPELIRGSVKCPVISCRFTSGAEPSYDGKSAMIPKEPMVTNLQIFIQEKRLELPKKTKDPDQAKANQEMLLQLQNFMRDMPKEGARAETFEAKVGTHDDLVTALGLAVWGAKHYRPCEPFVRRL